MTQTPNKVDKVKLRNQNQQTVIGEDGQPVMTREFHFIDKDGNAVIIQEHSMGHDFGGVGDQGPHFNVRPGNNPNGSVPGTKPHYNFQK